MLSDLINAEQAREKIAFEKWFAAFSMPCEADWFRLDEYGAYADISAYHAWTGWAARAGCLDDV